MGRLLVAVVLVVLAVWLLRRALRGGRDTHTAKDATPGSAPAPTQGELVRCAQCGVHLPRAEARVLAERPYCSDEHARLGPADGKKAG